MCGIYGFVNFSGLPFARSTLGKMGASLERRGPDGQGEYFSDVAALGHNRLAVIDLSNAGHQPMTNEDGSVWITFNGVIYNHRELRAELEQKHDFKSNSDTEVIIHGYEEYGEDLWRRLHGMFAFALWDENQRLVYLVRDQFSIKPLFYSLNNGTLIFASQIKGITSIPEFEIAYSPQGIGNFLSYFYVPGPETALENINQLEAGHYLKFSSNGEKIVRYHQIAVDPQPHFDEPALIRDIPLRLADAVKKSLVSDVPVGLLLSGGIDSSALLTEMVKETGEPVRTFTLGFGDDAGSYDESKFASEMSDQYGCESHQTTFTSETFADQIGDIVTACDSFNANPGLHAIYEYMKLAGENSKVVFMGSGADEMFAGYSTYKANKYLPIVQKLPVALRKLFLSVARGLPVGYEKYSWDYLAKKFFEGSVYPPEVAHYWWRTIFTHDEKSGLLDEDWVSTMEHGLDSSYKYLQQFEAVDGSFEDRALYADFRLFLEDNALLAADHLAMHFSLETRSPFLHQEFVEFAFQIPYQYKLKGGTTKYILRKAFAQSLPESTVKRKKLGVVAPLGQLFRYQLKEFVMDTLSGVNISSIPFLRPAAVEQVLGDHFSGRADNGYKIWCLIYLVTWDAQFRR